MIKRSRLEIYLDVLETVKNGVRKPTRIMYRTNLSWNPLQEVLDSMITQGLITLNTEGRRKRYEITDKGRSALKYFNQVKKLVTISDAKEKGAQAIFTL